MGSRRRKGRLGGKARRREGERRVCKEREGRVEMVNGKNMEEKVEQERRLTDMIRSVVEQK